MEDTYFPAFRAAAIQSTFKTRRTALPRSSPLALRAAFYELPTKQTQWGAFLRKSGLKADSALKEIIEVIREFVLPVVDGVLNGNEENQVLASILPYQTINLQKAKLAMKIGGEYRLTNIGRRHWKRFATELLLDEAWLIERIRTMAASLPNHATSIRNELEADGLSHITMTRLAQRLKARATLCLRLVQ